MSDSSSVAQWGLNPQLLTVTTACLFASLSHAHTHTLSVSPFSFISYFLSLAQFRKKLKKTRCTVRYLASNKQQTDKVSDCLVNRAEHLAAEQPGDVWTPTQSCVNKQPPRRTTTTESYNTTYKPPTIFRKLLSDDSAKLWTRNSKTTISLVYV